MSIGQRSNLDSLKTTERRGTGQAANVDGVAQTGDKGVTSVGLAVPSRQSVAGSPVTGAGTLTVTDDAQAANRVFAGPASGADAVPAFRALVDGDIPDLSDQYVLTAALVGASATRTSTDQTISNNTTTTLVFDTEVFDDAGMWSSGSGGDFTIPTGRDGRYLCVGSVLFAANATGRRIIGIYVNGTQKISTRQLVVDASTGCALVVSGVFNLEAGDVVTFRVFQLSGGDLAAIGSGGGSLTSGTVQRIK